MLVLTVVPLFLGLVAALHVLTGVTKGPLDAEDSENVRASNALLCARQSRPRTVATRTAAAVCCAAAICVAQWWFSCREEQPVCHCLPPRAAARGPPSLATMASVRAPLRPTGLLLARNRALFSARTHSPPLAKYTLPVARSLSDSSASLVPVASWMRALRSPPSLSHSAFLSLSSSSSSSSAPPPPAACRLGAPPPLGRGEQHGDAEWQHEQGGAADRGPATRARPALRRPAQGPRRNRLGALQA
jgi:hypothetical protein